MWKVWKTVPENDVFSCVPFCLRSLGGFAKCGIFCLTGIFKRALQTQFSRGGHRKRIDSLSQCQGLLPSKYHFFDIKKYFCFGEDLALWLESHDWYWYSIIAFRLRLQLGQGFIGIASKATQILVYRYWVQVFPIAQPRSWMNVFWEIDLKNYLKVLEEL